MKECVEKKDWETLTGWTRKPKFGFIEIEIVKPFKKWVSSQEAAAPKKVFVNPTTEDDILA